MIQRHFIDKLACIILIITSVVVCSENPLEFSTKECSLTEPVYGHKFDFSSLHSDLAHTLTSDKGDSFEYNVCGNLTRTCDGKSNVAACLRKDNKEYVLGTQHELHYKNGKLYFEYSGGSKCPNGSDNFKLHVMVGCGYIIDKDPTTITTYAHDSCSFYINLETPLACLPEPPEIKPKSQSCSVRDPDTGHVYDLLPLSDYNHRLIDRQGSVFVINICEPVLYGENTMCPPGSSVCYIKSYNSTDYKNKFFNYGTVQANPTFKNGKLQMKHPSTTPCNATANYTSVINFYCDKNVKSVHPVYIGFNGCEYQFSFFTPLVCNNLEPCTTVGRGNQILDLSPLKDKPFTLSMDGKNYTFAVCSHAGSPCLENDGSCFTEKGQSSSLGTSNSDLRFNQTGSPYLLYEGGAKCEVTGSSGNGNGQTSATKTWSTKIEFVCANNVSKQPQLQQNGNTNSAAEPAPNEGPKIIENSNCELLIHYETKWACQEQINCYSKIYVDQFEDASGMGVMEVLDLSPLISSKENYEAIIDSALITSQKVPGNSKFFINVCRPLVQTFGLGCAGNSAACMAKMDSSSPTPQDEKSLGDPMVSLVAINRTTAELRYLQGDVCPTDNKSTLSSGIQFYCDMKAGRGTPILRSISDCHYEFSWATNVICPPHICDLNEETCEITNNEINVSYNLKTAPYTNNGEIKVGEDEQHAFTFNVCGPHRKAVTDYSQGLVNLFFETKGPCSLGGNVNVQMRLICSNVTERTTSFTGDNQCNLIYVQYTPDICKYLSLDSSNQFTTTTPIVNPTQAPTTTTTKKSNPVVPPNGSTSAPTTNAPSEATDSHKTSTVGTIMAAILCLTFFVACAGMLAFSPERRRSIRRIFGRRSSSVRYSRVQSNEEANLLLEPNGEFTDSDDDMLL